MKQISHYALAAAAKAAGRAAKALVATVVCAAAYLTGVLSGDQGLDDVTTVQWLGLVVFVGAAYGITYRVPNRRPE